MCDLREAAENIAAMERAYKATGIPEAPTPDPKPAETVENVSLAIGLLTVVAGFFLT